MSLFSYEEEAATNDEGQQLLENLDPLVEPPTLEAMVEAMTPELRDAYTHIVDVCGVQVDEDENEDDESVIVVDPETGEEVDIMENLSLHELGFVDAEELRKFTLEAFHDRKLDKLNKHIQNTHHELGVWRHRLNTLGGISKADAVALDSLSNGYISSTMNMEAFTQRHTKNKLSFVLEEVTNMEKALSAGGVVLGLTIIYKLVQWFTKSWGNNEAAVSAMSSSLGTVSSVSGRIRGMEDIQNKAVDAVQKARNAFQQSTKESVSVDDFQKYLKQFGENMNDAEAADVLEKILGATVLNSLGSTLSLLWMAILTKGSVNNEVGKVPAPSEEVFKALAAMINLSKGLMHTVTNLVESIETTGVDESIPSIDKDMETFLKEIGTHAKTLGYDADPRDIVEYTNGFFSHINNIWLAKLPTINLNTKIDLEGVKVINVEVFALVDEKTLKEAETFYKRLNKANGGGFMNEDKVNVGDATQKDSRALAMKNISSSYRGAVNIFRTLLSIRNNLGRGLDTMAKVVKNIK